MNTSAVGAARIYDATGPTLAAHASARPSRLSPRQRRALDIGAHIVIVASIIGLAELVSGRFISRLVIPRPIEVLDAALNWITTGYLLKHLTATVQTITIGFLIGLALAFGVAVLFTALPRLGRFAEPYLIALSAVPSVALVPIVVMWLGLGQETKITMGILATFWPVVIAGYTGLKNGDAKLLELADIYGASPRQRLVNFRLWSAAPYFVSGIKVAIPKATLSVIVAEYLAGNLGLGFAILRSGNLLDTGGVFTGVVVITTIVFALSQLVAFLERKFLSWAQPREPEE